MYITVCPDSFKGSLTANDAAKTITEACQDVDPEATIVQKPMADGGEGTVDALIYATQGSKVEREVTGPLGEPTQSYFGIHGSEKIAFLEIANIAGLTQVPKDNKNPYETTSYGLGEMIIEAINLGYSKLVIGLGGSATNDGGFGMLQALGVKFYDEKGKVVGILGKDLLHVKRVDLTNLDPRLQDIDIQIASDVDNPLCGDRGASAIFGPQKGATEEQVKVLDQALHHFSSLIEAEISLSLLNKPGAGAAGGLGFALMAIGGKLISGAELVAKTIRLEDDICKSNLVITGEGKSDGQTLYGKAPGYVAKLAKTYEVPTILLSGSIESEEKLQEVFSGTFSIVNGPISIEEAIENANHLLYEQTRNIVRFYKSINK